MENSFSEATASSQRVTGEMSWMMIICNLIPENWFDSRSVNFLLMQTDSREQNKTTHVLLFYSLH